jgi:hypothetical protein
MKRLIVYNKKAKLYAVSIDPATGFFRNAKTVAENIKINTEEAPPMPKKPKNNEFLADIPFIKVENRKPEHEKFNPKHLKDYAYPLKSLGGDLYAVPDFIMCIVYEQTGKQPSENDRIITVFGDNIKNIKANP